MNTPDTPADDEPERDYESGPFCLHWADPSDCIELCATCNHACRGHASSHPHECDQPDCHCQGFEEAP